LKIDETPGYLVHTQNKPESKRSSPSPHKEGYLFYPENALKKFIKYLQLTFD
jgi:hypothetical protein